METPSSTKRVTRSQARAASLSNNNIPTSRKIEDSVKNTGSKQQDRSALLDISNDSPIVGLAMGILETPSSATTKKTISKIKNINNSNNNKTPGSGEALLRGQVKTLLQRVEEEAELSKIPLENRPFLRLQELFLNSSPMGLLAPTPANTPMIPDDLTHDNTSMMMISPLPVIQEQLKICEAVVSEMYNGRKLETLESQKSVNRQLLLDFSSEKSESCDSTTTESGSKEEKSSASEVTDDDNASIWSIQVNASTHDDDDDDYAVIEEAGEEVYDDGNYYSYSNQEEQEEGENYEEEEGSSGEVMIDELCEGIGRISVGFCGNHKRFEYNSDDELVHVGDGVVKLKGLPTPKGKHLRFSKKEECEENC